MIFYRVDADFVFGPPNIQNVVFLLGEYLMSKCSELGERTDIKEYIDAGKLKFGMDAWDEFANYIEEVQNTDMRYVRSFLDHKYLMYQRVKYLSENNYFQDAAAYMTNAENIYKQAVNIFYKVIKYACSPADIDSMQRETAEKIRKINGAEREYLSCLIYELERNCCDKSFA